jgi:hypothetical protein
MRIRSASSRIISPTRCAPPLRAPVTSPGRN